MNSRTIFLCFSVLLLIGLAGAQTHVPIVNLPTADNNPAVTTGNALPEMPHRASTTLDDPVGNVYLAGTTYYDLQHNGSAGKMLYVEPILQGRCCYVLDSVPTCAYVTHPICQSYAGQWDSTLTCDTPCSTPPPIGRCCYGDPQNPICHILTESICRNVAGRWDSLLTCNTPCPVEPPTLGRCCYMSDSVDACLVVTHQVCVSFGGQWDSTLTCNTPCSTPPVMGRCCYGDPQNPVCHMLTEFICNTMAGRWDSSLTCNTPCPMEPPTLGRCCYLSDSVDACANVIHQVCAGLGGQWDSTLTCNTPCSTPHILGRCCYGDPQNPNCTMFTEAICRNVAGRWDSSLTCTTPCPVAPPTVGRCCYMSDSVDACANVTHQVCLGFGGQWDSTLTCDTPCSTLPPIGRCCYGNPEQPSCAMIREVACHRIGGTWNDSLTCATSCPAIPPYEARCCYGPDPMNPVCQMISRTLCTIYAGQWDSLLTCNTPCPIIPPVIGRCCYGYGPLSPYCAMATHDLCDAIGGAWNGSLNCETPCQDSTVFCSFRDQQNVFCNTVGGSIPDADPTGTDFVIHVPTQYHITRLTAAIDITHPNDMDLIITLRSPAGHVSVLSSQQGPGGADYLCTVFDDQAFDSVAGGYPPCSGTWLPMTPLEVFNDENAMGDWILHVTDVYSGNVGRLNWACVYIEYDRILPVELMSFEVASQSDGIHVTFATASENNNQRFEILRGTSQTGNFLRVASLNSQGNSSTQQTYHFVDAAVTPGQTYWYYLADVSLNGARTEHRDVMQSASMVHSIIPTEYSLSVYPNPFNPATTIQFSLTEASLVRLTFYDVTGRSVGVPLEKRFEAGVYHQNFDGSGLPAGVYFVRIDTGHFSKSLKMLLLK